MNFVGTGRRLAQNDIGDAARLLGVETAVLLAFLEVEAAGRGFDSRNRPKMLRETHIFYRELGPGAKRDQAVAAGLATRVWTRNYKSESYSDLDRMLKIDQDKALRSCSWGLSQIMGFNCKDAGHATAKQMVDVAMQGEREQLIQMVTLMRKWGMVPMLTNRDFTNPESWRPAAHKWNGSGYATHGYHTKLATAYRKHKKAEGTLPAPEIAPLLVLGMKGEHVRNLQADLTALGYVTGPIDGRFGQNTLQAVKDFQLEENLTVDGKFGNQTRLTLQKALQRLENEMVPDAPVWEGNGDSEPVLPTPEVPIVDYPIQKKPEQEKSVSSGAIAGIIAAIGAVSAGIAKFFGWI